MKMSAVAIEALLREDRLAEGDEWFLVSSWWWRRALGPVREADTEADGEAMALTDEDSEGSAEADAGAVADAEDAGAPRVANEGLLEVELSSRRRGVAVLRPMLAEGRDFRLVSQRVWNMLSHEFGYDWEIARPVVARGPSRQLVIDIYPVAFQVLVWTNGLEKPIEAMEDDERATPIAVLANVSTDLKELKLRIWDAMQPRAAHYLPGITENNAKDAVRVCYRLSEDAPWVSLDHPEVEAKAAATVCVGDLQLEPRDYHHGKAKFHHLLVETRFIDAMAGGKDWRHGHFCSEVLEKQWRFELKVGDLVDALDSDKKWYESWVVAVDEKRVKVHYRGWTDKWDEWLERLSDRLQKSHAKVPNWRAFRVGDAVQVGFPQTHKNFPDWRNGSVVEVETSGEDTDSGGGVRVQVAVNGEKQWMEAQSEMLCPPETHKASNVSTAITTVSPSYTNRYADRSRGYEYEHGRGKSEFKGVVGLQNLGNTCFMNSMLQCLINSPPLKDYFLEVDPDTSKLKFVNDINVDNPLGMKGRIAIEFANLLKKMWSGEYTSIAPTQLKSVIGQYAPQFAGYQQQDSQEVMNFLLDGLHEDLNRVKQKPYTTPVDPDGRSDEEVAHEEWQQYLRRNDSVIVDNFMGQLRSHVTCSDPECNNESVTFDPFMSLSVPVPSEDFVDVQVQLFWANGNIPTRYAVRVDKTGGCVRDVKAKLSELSGLPTNRIFVVDVWNHRIVKAYGDALSLERVRDGVLHAYELEQPVTEYDFSSPLLRPPSSMRFSTSASSVAAKPMKLVGLLHQAPVASPVDRRVAEPNDSEDMDAFGGGAKQRRVEVELFNTPLLVSINRESSKADVHRKVWRIVHRLVAEKEPTATEEERPQPYRLHVTAPTGTTTFVSDLQPEEDVPFEFLSEDTRSFSFLLEWSRNGYQSGYDDDSAKRIELHNSMKQLSITPASTEKTEITLLNCLSKFTEREQLETTDTWYCPKCKQHVRAFKKFDLFSLPRVLIFHLKRFRYAQSSFYLHRDKITKLVEFPIEGLDLSEYVVGPKDGDKPLMYDLFAVSEHSGGLGGGHYTAVAKNPDNERWFSFNDSFTSETSADHAVTPKAYVLFYVRRDA